MPRKARPHSSFGPAHHDKAPRIKQKPDYGVATHERNVLNHAKAWYREMLGYMKREGITFKEMCADAEEHDLTSGERRLYQMVSNLIAAERRRNREG